MEHLTKITIVVLVFLSVGVSCTGGKKEEFDATNCPNKGRAYGGHWRVDDYQGPRCILSCYKGYQPSGCNVLRPIGENGWTFEVPTCEEEPVVSGKTLLAIGTGIASILAAPVVLPALGFGAAGVAAGSVAAAVQGPATAAGSWFAVAQSAGAAGMAVTTKAGIGSAVGAMAYAASSDQNGGCEPI